MIFDDYIRHGWTLCAIEPGSKAPTYKEWNARGLGQVVIPPGYGAGLMHVESGTCAIDIDQMEVATPWLASRGVHLDSLLTAPSAVKISSGRTGRAKLVYRLGSPLVSKKDAPFQRLSPKSGKLETYTAIDFRCATKGGLSMQEVLPPTVHPDTGKPYEWAYGDVLTGTWRNLPELPPELRAVWESLICDSHIANDAPAAPLGAGFDEMRTLLTQQDPNAAYNEWLRVGMALHHETGGSREGLLLWNEWSAQATGPDKYKGVADLEPHWRSFSSNTAGAVTLGSLRAEAVAGVNDFPVVPASTKVAEAARKRFELLTFDDFTSGPPPEWIIEDVLPKGTLMIVYGAPGSGKSFWTTDLMSCAAAGRQWRDKVTNRCRVAYIVCEGVPGTRQRLAAAKREFGLETDDFRIMIDTPNLREREDVIPFVQSLQAWGNVGLVVIDTLAQATPGADENSGKDMSVAIEHCKRVREVTGAMVVLIAHSGKDETRGMRGWSGFKGAVDAEVEVTKGADDLRMAQVTKMKDGEDQLKFPFRLRHVDDGTKRGTLVVEHTDEEPRARVAKRSNAPAIVHFHTICVERLGVGVGIETGVEDALAEVLARMATPPGEYEQASKKHRRSIDQYLATDSCPFKLRNGKLCLKDDPQFGLHPVGNPGIDGEPPKAQDHADLLGV